MLDEVEKVLPGIGIYHTERPRKGCRLYAFKTAGDREAIVYLFTAHPAAGYLEIGIRGHPGSPEREDGRLLARIYLKEVKDLRRAVRKALTAISKDMI